MAWDGIEHELWERALSEMDADVASRISADPFAESFYMEAMWDWNLAGDVRAEMYENFTGYMEDYYGIEWEEYFDWDDWREAYDSQAG
jgi:hypothetical protein